MNLRSILLTLIFVNHPFGVLGTQDACEDSSTWYAKDASKGCAWVSKKPSSRCGTVTKLKAKDACVKTCGDGDADSSWWYSKKAKNGCGWARRRRPREQVQETAKK
jgi:hypothetical protein